MAGESWFGSGGRGFLEEGEPELVGELWAQAQGDAPPRAVAGEQEQAASGAYEEEGPAVGADADQLLDPRRRDQRVAEELAEPAEEVLGEEDQLLVDRDARFVAGGQVAAGEGPFPLFYRGLDGLPPVVEGAHAARRPGLGAQLRVGHQRRPALGLALAPPLAAGEQAHRVGRLAERRPRAFGDEAVLAHLLPAQRGLLAQALADAVVVGPGDEIVALLVQPGQIGRVAEAAVQPQDDPPRVRVSRVLGRELVAAGLQRGDQRLLALPLRFEVLHPAPDEDRPLLPLGDRPLDRLKLLPGLPEPRRD